MVKDLPPTFDDFPTEAKIDFLKEARSLHEILAYIHELVGMEYEKRDGMPRTEVLAVLYVHLQQEIKVPDQDTMQADETQ